MNDPHLSRRRGRLLAAAAVAATMLPMAGTTGPAYGRGDKPAYGGYATSASATPIRIEVYEPSLPIPVDAGIAQLEFDMGYSKVRADSGMSEGRSSLFWPGDPVGEGLKTFAEQLGLPSTPLTENGYPVQVNSKYPSDQTSQTDTKIPGSIMRTTSTEGAAIAETGFSPDGAVIGPDLGDGKDGAKPGGSGNPLTDLLSQLGGALGGKNKTATAAAPGLPPGLDLIVDIDGYVSVSRMKATGSPVVGAARSTLGEVRLLGGLITFGGLDSVARVSSDGTKGVASGKATWGGMTIAGQSFDIGPDGITAAGKTTPIPGLKQLPLDLLKNLGINIEVPEAVHTVDGDQATSVAEGLRITIDTVALSPLIKTLPTGLLADLLPPEVGLLKGVVAGLSSLAPKIVITLGQAQATVDTVPPVGAVPGGTADGGSAAAPPPAAAGAPAPAVSGVPPVTGPAPSGAAPDASGAPPAVADLVDAAPASAGLPDLFSIPGMLLVGALALAAVAGSWLRRLGAAALGAGAPCVHGLDSGLPDLRKA